MADDLTLPATNAVVATDEVAARHFQLIKPAFGSDGSATLVDAANGLPVANGSAAADAATATLGAAQLGYNGATWDRRRTPNVVKTVAATASGNTSLWAPGVGNRWRLQRLMVTLSADATIAAAGVLTIELRDGASTAVGVTVSPYVPSTGGTTLGGWTTGWLDLGNGIRSAADNQDLNVNLSAALATGVCRVIACGTQGTGTAA